jgi:chromosome segregation ATPase
MRRHRPPTLVSMWMLDVFCCALGCVTLLWLLKTREAGKVSNEAALAAANLIEARMTLADTSKESALRLATKLQADIDALKKQLALVQDERDENSKNLALMRQERDENAKNLALAEKELAKTKQDLVAARTKVDELDKSLSGLNSKLTTNDTELAKKKA